MLSDNLFPDLLLLTYNHKLSSLLFWVAFMTMGYFVLMNLTFRAETHAQFHIETQLIELMKTKGSASLRQT